VNDAMWFQGLPPGYAAFQRSQAPGSFGGGAHKKDERKGRWQPDEQLRFQEALEMYGSGDWQGISQHVGSRSVSQVRSHAHSLEAKSSAASLDEFGDEDARAADAKEASEALVSISRSGSPVNEPKSQPASRAPTPSGGPLALTLSTGPSSDIDDAADDDFVDAGPSGVL